MSEETNTTNVVNETDNTVAGQPAVKWACVLAYLVFFIPLIVEGDKEVHRFHANQGLLILLLNVISGVLVWTVFIPIIIGIFCLVLMIMGMINASNDQMKELPLIGKIKIIK